MTSVQSTNRYNNDLDEQYEQKLKALDDAIQCYRQALETIEGASEPVSDQQISDVFAACKRSHDGLEALILQINAARKVEQPSSNVMQTVKFLTQNIDALDARLRKKSEFIQKSIELFNWQKTYLLPDKSRLKLIDPPATKDRFIWLWRLLSLIFFGISFALLTDIIKRSLTGGIDAGSAITIVGSTLLSLGSGSVLVQFRDENLRQIVSSFRVPENRYERALAVISFVLLLLLYGGWLNLPRLADWNVSLAEHAENLAKSEDYYTRAIALEPGNVKAQLGLADMYYDQEEYDKALEKYITVWKHNKKKQTEYSKAAVKALERITRIAILKKEVGRANTFLKKLLEVIDLKKNPGSLTDSQLTLIQNLGRIYLITEKNYVQATYLFNAGFSGTLDSPRRYEMLTYKGWTQIRQGLLDDAEPTLKSAIGIEGQKDRAPAHCLLAQVFQMQASKQQSLSTQLAPREELLLKQAKHEWETCRNNQEGTEDEINWLVQATDAVKTIDTRLQVANSGNQ